MVVNCFGDVAAQRKVIVIRRIVGIVLVKVVENRETIAEKNRINLEEVQIKIRNEVQLEKKEDEKRIFVDFMQNQDYSEIFYTNGVP